MIYISLLNDKEEAIDESRIELLNNELEYASSIYKVEPIISMSIKTYSDLKEICKSYQIEDYTSLYDYISLYKGYKIFTDNAIPYGHILIR